MILVEWGFRHANRSRFADNPFLGLRGWRSRIFPNAEFRPWAGILQKTLGKALTASVFSNTIWRVSLFGEFQGK
jgi:hypothetical protein